MSLLCIALALGALLLVAVLVRRADLRSRRGLRLVKVAALEPPVPFPPPPPAPKRVDQPPEDLA